MIIDYFDRTCTCMNTMIDYYDRTCTCMNTRMKMTNAHHQSTTPEVPRVLIAQRRSSPLIVFLFSCKHLSLA